MRTGSIFQKRLFGQVTAIALGILTAMCLVQCGKGGDSVTFVKEPLPYAKDALAPVISADTMGFHYDKHYAGYVKKANDLTRGGNYAGKSPEDVIRMTADHPDRAAVFNNAAQAWNHAFFFKCLKPDGGGQPEGALAEMIDAAFGDVVNFKELFLTAAKDQFGSGWVWLVLDGEELAVVTGANADTPLAHDLTPLFTVDVWEHAYYLDYQNRRVEFVKSVLDNLANWDFVAAELEKALPAKEAAATEDEP
jgi:Fe-Mn family superoxide dismutase